MRLMASSSSGFQRKCLTASPNWPSLRLAKQSEDMIISRPSFAASIPFLSISPIGSGRSRLTRMSVATSSSKPFSRSSGNANVGSASSSMSAPELPPPWLPPKLCADFLNDCIVCCSAGTFGLISLSSIATLQKSSMSSILSNLMASSSSSLCARWWSGRRFLILDTAVCSSGCSIIVFSGTRRTPGFSASIPRTRSGVPSKLPSALTKSPSLSVSKDWSEASRLSLIAAIASMPCLNATALSHLHALSCATGVLTTGSAAPTVSSASWIGGSRNSRRIMTLMQLGFTVFKAMSSLGLATMPFIVPGMSPRLMTGSRSRNSLTAILALWILPLSPQLSSFWILSSIDVILKLGCFGSYLPITKFCTMPQICSGIARATWMIDMLMHTAAPSSSVSCFETVSAATNMIIACCPICTAILYPLIRSISGLKNVCSPNSARKTVAMTHAFCAGGTRTQGSAVSTTPRRRFLESTKTEK
mmetsp:Transcript_56770/g.132987  ORF Transcript_56770/g.132987 Transcript_56770/m.132987 type:complete len:475 (-) Transcript_56770:2435-3859(-)